MLAGIDDTWDACLHTLKFPKRWVSSVTYSPDSKLLLLAFFDGMVEIRDASTGELQRRHNGSAVYDTSTIFPGWPQIIALACSPSGDYVLAALVTGVLHKWDTTSSTTTNTVTSFVLEELPRDVHPILLMFDPLPHMIKDVNFIFSSSRPGCDVVIFLSPTGKLNVLEFSSDGSQLTSIDPSSIPDEFQGCSFIGLSTCDETALLYTTENMWTWDVLCRDEPKSIPLPHAEEPRRRSRL